MPLCGFAASEAHAQRYRPPEQYLQGKPDQAEGRKILEEFRNLGVAGTYYFDFQLHILPRRGDETVMDGRLWGARIPGGGVSRIEFPDGSGADRLLVQNGPDPSIWSFAGPGSPAKVSDSTLSLAGTDLTTFDLQMPFLYWTDFAYEGIARIRSRPAYQFILYPPADYAARYPRLRGVRIYIDTQYKALIQSEQIGDRGAILKTWIIVDLKKVADTWIPNSIEVRDEETHNKTRFVVTAVAIDGKFSGDPFTPASLATPATPPAGVTRLIP